MTKGTLDRFLKDKTSSEQKKENALRWLEEFKEAAQ